MGIGADLVEYFHTLNANLGANGLTPKSLGDFIRDTNHKNVGEITHICRQLVAQGFLVPAGHSTNTLIVGEAYYSFEFESNAALYGVYDFVALGFPLIRAHFAEAVRPVVVSTSEDIQDIGSGFLLEDHRFVTAAHCILDMKEVEIPGWVPANAPLLNIWKPTDKQLDLAVLDFERDPFPGIQGFRLQDAELLDNVLTMGYPPIPGFESVQVAETAQIAGYLQSSTGQVVGKEKSYLDKQTYCLISARVKGGNSGGPVIGKQGKVVGVVTQLPADVDGRADTLGYAAALPSTTLEQVLQNCDRQTDFVQKVQFRTTPRGFSTD